VKPVEISENMSNECPTPVRSNPFGDDFVRLFNEAGRNSEGSGADREGQTD
jgi:hypothetical protein